MSYEIGELDERVTLERIQHTRDGAGGATEVWSTYDTVWARVRPMTGRERTAAQRVEATANYLVVVRNRDDITEANRIGWRGRTLNIRFIKSRGARAQFLEIEAELGQAS